MNFRLIIVLLSVILSSSSVMAQMTGIAIEVDTAFYGVDTPTPDDTFDVLGELDGYVTYRVYAEFTNTTDVLSAIYSDITQPTSPVEIDAECGCFDPLFATFTMDPSNSSLFWNAFPFWEYDSYWTIGMASADADGVLPLYAATNVDGTEVCSASITDGAIFSFGVPENAIAGDDLRVLIAQITTCGDWCFSANFQVFIEGNQQEELIQYFLLEEQICTPDPCEPYLTQDATVTGAVLPCAGGSSTVEVEFLGLGAADQATYSLLDQGGNTIVDAQNNSSFDDLSPGNYSMVIVDEFYCRDTTTFVVTAPDPIEADFDLGPDNDCFGAGDATVCLLEPPIGGTGSLTISVDDPSGNPVASVDGQDECWTNLICHEGIGSFSFTVQDNEGCSLDTVITINCPQPIVAVISTEQIDCHGNANGMISAEASGGSGDLYLSVNTDTLLLPNSSSDLAPGIYNVQIIDSFGCSPEIEIVEITDPDPLTLQIVSAAPISCGSDCNGAVDLLYFGGTGELAVQITNSITGVVSESLDSLCTSDYFATVVDENGCENQIPFLIDAPPPLEFLISPSPATCTGMSDGSADIFPAGGTGELTWTVVDTLGNVANLNNLSEMTYTAIVTDVLGCEFTDTFSILTDSLCLDYDGCMDITACNYDPIVIIDDGSCEVWDECGICGGDGSSCVQTCLDDDDAVSAVGGCFNAVDLLGCSFYWDDILISELCPESCNNCPCDNDFNDNGVCDDVEVFSCTYPDAINYNSLATADNGSCVFESTNACPADLDGNGVVATQDLLSFLSLFGEICE